MFVNQEKLFAFLAKRAVQYSVETNVTYNPFTKRISAVELPASIYPEDKCRAYYGVFFRDCLKTLLKHSVSGVVSCYISLSISNNSSRRMLRFSSRPEQGAVDIGNMLYRFCAPKVESLGTGELEGYPNVLAFVVENFAKVLHDEVLNTKPINIEAHGLIRVNTYRIEHVIQQEK
jgi:hypothetical protein